MQRIVIGIRQYSAAIRQIIAHDLQDRPSVMIQRPRLRHHTVKSFTLTVSLMSVILYVGKTASFQLLKAESARPLKIVIGGGFLNVGNFFGQKLHPVKIKVFFDLFQQIILHSTCLS